jgi:DnaJ-related protein SCJ1
MQGLEEFEKNGGGQQHGGMFDMFGGGGGMRKGHNFQIEVKCTLKELYLGTTKKISIQRNEICHECMGTGAHNGETHKCPHCQGKGVVIQEVRMGPGMVMRQQVHCPHCRGRGQHIKQACKFCHGHRVQRKTKEFEVDIEKGMRDGQTIVYENEAEQSPDHLPGDVIFIVRQNDDPYFQRHGNDLLLNLRVTLKEALGGFSKTVNHLDGEKVLVETDNVSWPDSIIRLEGKGMPIHNSPLDRGNLNVKLKLTLPNRLTDKQKELVNQILR